MFSDVKFTEEEKKEKRKKKKKENKTKEKKKTKEKTQKQNKKDCYLTSSFLRLYYLINSVNLKIYEMYAEKLQIVKERSASKTNSFH